MTNRPLSVIATYFFILLSLLIWLVLGIIIAVDALPGLPNLLWIKWILAILSIVMAGVILMLFIFLNRGSRKAYYLILAVLFFTALLTIFDEIGVSDLVILALNIIPIILLIKDRAWYLRATP